MDRTTLSRPLADVLATLDPGEADAAYDHLGLATLSDHALVSACAAVIDRPKAAPPDSFVLHAPLELMARAGLLARVGPDARDVARRRLVRFADGACHVRQVGRFGQGPYRSLQGHQQIAGVRREWPIAKADRVRWRDWLFPNSLLAIRNSRRIA